MKLQTYIAFLVMACATSTLHGQGHRDIEFGYDDASNPTQIVYTPQGFVGVTADGIDVYESSMVALDPFLPNDFSNDQPGFATDLSEGLMVNPADLISLNFLDASQESSFGVGYVNFYNPATDKLEATGRIEVEDNTNSTIDLVLNGDSVESGDLLQLVDLADSGGEVHNHITWDLLDDDTAPNGAYGLLVELESSSGFSSDTFWIVFNHGMSATDFEELALPKFGVGIPAQIASMELNGGENQRSAVETLTVLFDSEVTIAPGAFSLIQRSTATEETFESVTINVTEQVVGGQTQATIMFDSHTRNSDNALEDGNYQLTVNACFVSNDGTPMLEDLVFGAVEADAFYTYFGDSDGNRTLNVFDLLSFRQSFGSTDGDGDYVFFMDFNASGNINVFDLLPFRSRYFTTLPFTFGSSRSSSLLTGRVKEAGTSLIAAPKKLGVNRKASSFIRRR